MEEEDETEVIEIGIEGSFVLGLVGAILIVSLGRLGMLRRSRRQKRLWLREVSDEVLRMSTKGPVAEVDQGLDLLSTNPWRLCEASISINRQGSV